MSPPPARVDELRKRYEENPRRFFAPLASEYRKSGDLDAAIDLCKLHLEEQPGHLSGHIVYGQALFEAGRPADARTTFEAALQLDPENLIALRHLGDISATAGDSTSATQWYRRVLDADPRNVEVIALIEGLRAPPSLLHQAIATPPTPSYAVQAPAVPAVNLSFIGSSAPTPIIPIEAIAPPAVPPAVPPVPAAPPAPRVSGLLNLDLSLHDEWAPAISLLADETTASMPLNDAFEVPAPKPRELDDTGSFFSEPDRGPPVEDTSFGVPVDVAPERIFDDVPPEPAFGDSLDVTAIEAFELPAAADAPVELSVNSTADAPTVDAPTVDAPTVDAPTVDAPTADGPTADGPTAAEPPADTAPIDVAMLFGSAPIADVFVGDGDDSPLAAPDAGFVIDSFVGRELTEESIDQSSELGGTPLPFVTETMAELYLQQGFHDEALELYRQLLAQNPEDAGLADRIKNLEHGSRSSMALESEGGQIEAAEAAPALLAEAREEAEPAEPAKAAQSAVAAGSSVRELLSRIATRRAVPGGGRTAAPVVEPPTDPSRLPAIDPAWGGVLTEVAPAPLGDVSAGGEIDSLFGGGGISADDEDAAAGMSSAFAAMPDPGIQGHPTYRGTDELSLDSVFGDATAGSAPQVQRQSTKLRFDQFFAEADESPSGSPPHAATEPGKGAEDIAQFSDWLKGLKGS